LKTAVFPRIKISLWWFDEKALKTAVVASDNNFHEKATYFSTVLSSKGKI
jgi:hypothetical protein